MYIIAVVYYYCGHEDDRRRKRCILSKYKMCRLYTYPNNETCKRRSISLENGRNIFDDKMSKIGHIFDRNRASRFWYRSAAVGTRSR